MNLRQMYDRKMGQIVESDNARRALEAFVKQDRAISGSMNSDERVRTMRRQREQGDRDAELKIEQSIEYQKKLAEQRLSQKEDEVIGEALQRQELQRKREELEIRRIREQSTELRDLEQKLRAAYLTKDLNRQKEEKKQAEMRKAQEERLLDIELEADRLRKLKADEEKRASLVAQAYEKKRVLDIQMEERHMAQKQAYEEFQREKRMVDDIIAKIMEEERLEQMEKMKKRNESVEMMRQFMEDRERWKAEEVRRQQAEDDAINKYKESVASRDGAWAERQKALEEEKQRIFDRISAEVTAKQREQEEFLELQIVLSMQEAEEKRVREDKARAEKRLRDKVEMMAANEHQKAVKAQILAQEAEEEEKFRQRMLQKFADDEKTEQMANDKRRMRVQAHKKAVEDLIVKRREERAAAKAAEVADINDQKERERLLRETIEKERQRILGEHAARLGLDFLPRGLLANQSDLQMFKDAQAQKGGAAR